MNDHERRVFLAWNEAIAVSGMLLDFSEILDPRRNDLGKRASAVVRIVASRDAGDGSIKFAFKYDGIEETT